MRVSPGRPPARPGWGGDLTGYTIGGNKVVTTIPTNPDDQTVNKALYGLINWRISWLSLRSLKLMTRLVWSANWISRKDSCTSIARPVALIN